MTVNGRNPEPQPLLAKLAMQCLDDSHRWFPTVVTSIPHHTLAMFGECGEFANLIKKVERGDLKIEDAKTRFDIAMELTDIFIYVLNLAGLLQIDLEQAYYHKRGINESRFGSRVV